MGNHKSNIENLVSDCNIYSISYRAHASSLFNAITFGKSNLVSTEGIKPLRFERL